MQTQKAILRKIINSRWILFPVSSIIIFISSYIVANVYAKSIMLPPKQIFPLALYTCTGPFAASVAGWMTISESVNWVFGVPCLLLIFLHPLRPRTLTAVITLIGFMVWLFMGIVMVYVKP